MNGKVTKITGESDEALVETKMGENIIVAGDLLGHGFYFADYYDDETKQDAIVDYVAGRTGMPVFIGDNITFEKRASDGFFRITSVILEKGDPRKLRPGT
jgi:hypothetical protein